MFVRRKIPLRVIWRFAWRNLVVYTLYGTGVLLMSRACHTHGIDISLPFAPLGTIGVAVAFYVSFKNNQAYDRFWEARKLWGGIVNVSRTFANQVLSFWRPEEGAATEAAREQQRELIYRHLSWINALRIQLRATTTWDRDDHLSYRPKINLRIDREHTEDFCVFLSEEEGGAMRRSKNAATQVLRRQGEEISRGRDQGQLDAFRESQLHGSLAKLYDLQGACERIKNTPFPRQYAYFSLLFVNIFIALLPFALLSEFQRLGDAELVWLVVPFSVLISWIFSSIEVIGDNSEDPFENYINDVPMTALCKTIEIDLREMLGETDLPDKPVPINDILM